MRLGGYVVAMVALLIVSGAASAGAPQWSVTPPAGWQDVSAAALQQPGIKQHQQSMAAIGGVMEVAGYQSAQGDNFVVVFLRMPAAGAAGEVARGFEAGAHETTGQAGADSSYTVREDHNTLVAEQVFVASGQTIRARRLSGVNDSHLLSVTGTCKGPESVCVQALHSMTLDRSGFRPLDSHGGRRSSSAYQIGYALGRLVPVLAVLLLVRWLLRIRNKKRSA